MHRYTSRVFGNKTNLVAEQPEQDSGFSAATLSVRAQKKIASKLSTRKTTKFFLSDAVVRVFDSFYKVLRTYYPKKDSEKVRYSFERSYLIDLLKKMQSSLTPLVSLKLSDKSTRRLEHVIAHLTNIGFLDIVFKVDGPHAEVLAEFISGLEDLVENKDL
ncbi:hypothetical protein NECAME_01608 [Necator americanus]|uniref:Uncharacterized protein n=1 Tax=Necator americanus TaxID=51031 RepID=W2TQQ2_NECAM|nr:hypothetical protein NECAME_01608 [Necator americanus]ETN84385.1 hypothetical protein NECAME_01608 [Necator americanus]